MIEDVIAKVIDDLFGHRRCSHGTMNPDPDELMLFALEVLKKVGVRNPKKDTPWIKQFVEREKALLQNERLEKAMKIIYDAYHREPVNLVDKQPVIIDWEFMERNQG